MHEDFKYLLDLSDFDKTIYNLRKANINLPTQIAYLKSEMEKAESAMKEISDAVSEYEKKISDNKAFIESENEALIASNKRLENITTNKEYDAVHAEIATHNHNVEEAQANTLHFQQVLENLKEDKKKIEETSLEIIEKSRPELDKLNTELDSLEGRISEEEKKSQIPRSKIGKQIINVYDRTKKRRKSPYIISTINWDSKVCVVCNRAQPPQKINEISKMHTLVTCETCGSILVWKEDQGQEPGETADAGESSGASEAAGSEQI